MCLQSGFVELQGSLRWSKEAEKSEGVWVKAVRKERELKKSLLELLNEI